jgi:GNAT superfamily N-acetyltransferase
VIVPLSSSPVSTDVQPAGSARSPLPTVFGLWNWVPIRSLASRHRPRIAAHLRQLGEHDRYLRFGYPATDEQIGKYVDMLDFERDEVFGVFNRRLELIAMAHLANSPSAMAGDRRMAEFGVSVLAPARGRRYGARLFEHAVLHARNRGVDSLFIHALSENTAMLKIARNAGAVVRRDGPESEAWLQLPPETIGTRFNELMEQQAAEIDYRFKVHAHRMNEILEAIAEVKSQLGDNAPAASE